MVAVMPMSTTSTAKDRLALEATTLADPREKHHRRVDKSVQGVHAQQAGGHDGVVDDRLKHQRGAADGKGAVMSMTMSLGVRIFMA